MGIYRFVLSLCLIGALSGEMIHQRDNNVHDDLEEKPSSFRLQTDMNTFENVQYPPVLRQNLTIGFVIKSLPTGAFYETIVRFGEIAFAVNSTSLLIFSTADDLSPPSFLAAFALCRLNGVVQIAITVQQQKNSLMLLHVSSKIGSQIGSVSISPSPLAKAGTPYYVSPKLACVSIFNKVLSASQIGRLPFASSSSSCFNSSTTIKNNRRIARQADDSTITSPVIAVEPACRTMPYFLLHYWAMDTVTRAQDLCVLNLWPVKNVDNYDWIVEPGPFGLKQFRQHNAYVKNRKDTYVEYELAYIALNRLTIGFYVNVHLLQMPGCTFKTEFDMAAREIFSVKESDKLLIIKGERKFAIMYCIDGLVVDVKNVRFHLRFPTNFWMTDGQWKFLAVRVHPLNVTVHSSSGVTIASAVRKINYYEELEFFNTTVYIARGHGLKGVFCLTHFEEALTPNEISKIPYMCYSRGILTDDKSVMRRDELYSIIPKSLLLSYWHLKEEAWIFSGLDDFILGRSPSESYPEMVSVVLQSPNNTIFSRLTKIFISEYTNVPLAQYTLSDLLLLALNEVTISFLHFASDVKRNASSNFLLVSLSSKGVGTFINLMGRKFGLSPDLRRQDGKGNLLLSQEKNVSFISVTITSNGKVKLHDEYGTELAGTEVALDWPVMKNVTLAVGGSHLEGGGVHAITCLSIYAKILAPHLIRRLYCYCLYKADCPPPSPPASEPRCIYLPGPVTNDLVGFWPFGKWQLKPSCLSLNISELFSSQTTSHLAPIGPFNEAGYKSENNNSQPIAKFNSNRTSAAFTVAFFFSAQKANQCPRGNDFTNVDFEFSYSTLFRIGRQAPSFGLVVCNLTLYAVFRYAFNVHIYKPLQRFDLINNWDFIAVSYEEPKNNNATVRLFDSTGLLTRQFKLERKLEIPTVFVPQLFGALADGDAMFCFAEFNRALSRAEIARIRCVCKFSFCADNSTFLRLDVDNYFGPRYYELLGFLPLARRFGEKISDSYGLEDAIGSHWARQINAKLLIPQTNLGNPFGEGKFAFYDADDRSMPVAEYQITPMFEARVTISFFRYVSRHGANISLEPYLDLITRSDGKPILEVIPDDGWMMQRANWKFVCFYVSSSEVIWYNEFGKEIVNQNGVRLIDIDKLTEPVNLRIGPFRFPMAVVCLHIHLTKLDEAEIARLRCVCETVGKCKNTSATPPTSFVLPNILPEPGCLKGLTSPANDFLGSYVSMDIRRFGMAEICWPNRSMIVPDGVSAAWSTGPFSQHNSSITWTSYTADQRIYPLQEFSAAEIWQFDEFTISFYLYIDNDKMSSSDFNCSNEHDDDRSYVLEYGNFEFSKGKGKLRYRFAISYCKDGLIAILSSSLLNSHRVLVPLVRRFQGWNMFAITGSLKLSTENALLNYHYLTLRFYTQSGEPFYTSSPMLTEFQNFQAFGVGRGRYPLALSCVTRFAKVLTPAQISLLPRFCCSDCSEDKPWRPYDGTFFPDKLIAYWKFVETDGAISGLDDIYRKTLPIFVEPKTFRPVHQKGINLFKSIDDKTELMPLAIFDKVPLRQTFSMLLKLYSEPDADSYEIMPYPLLQITYDDDYDGLTRTLFVLKERLSDEQLVKPSLTINRDPLEVVIERPAVIGLLTIGLCIDLPEEWLILYDGREELQQVPFPAPWRSWQRRDVNLTIGPYRTEQNLSIETLALYDGCLPLTLTTSTSTMKSPSTRAATTRIKSTVRAETTRELTTTKTTITTTTTKQTTKATTTTTTTESPGCHINLLPHLPPAVDFLQNYISFDERLFGMADACRSDRTMITPSNDLETDWCNGPFNYSRSAVQLLLDSPGKTTLFTLRYAEPWTINTFTVGFFLFLRNVDINLADGNCSNYNRLNIFGFHQDDPNGVQLVVSYCLGGMVVVFNGSKMSNDYRFVVPLGQQRLEGWNMFAVTLSNPIESCDEWTLWCDKYRWLSFYSQSGELLFKDKLYLSGERIDKFVVGPLKYPARLSCVTRFSRALSPAEISQLPRFCCVKCQADVRGGARLPWKIYNGPYKNILVAFWPLIEEIGIVPGLDDMERKFPPIFLEPKSYEPQVFIPEFPLNNTKLFVAANQEKPVVIYGNVNLSPVFSMFLFLVHEELNSSGGAHFLLSLSAGNTVHFVLKEQVDFTGNEHPQLVIEADNSVIIKRSPSKKWSAFGINIMFNNWIGLYEAKHGERDRKPFSVRWNDWKQFNLTLGPYRPHQGLAIAGLGLYNDSIEAWTVPMPSTTATVKTTTTTTTTTTKRMTTAAATTPRLTTTTPPTNRLTTTTTTTTARTTTKAFSTTTAPKSTAIAVTTKKTTFIPTTTSKARTSTVGVHTTATTKHQTTAITTTTKTIRLKTTTTTGIRTTTMPMSTTTSVHRARDCYPGLESPANNFLVNYLPMDQTLFGVADVCWTNRTYSVFKKS